MVRFVIPTLTARGMVHNIQGFGPVKAPVYRYIRKLSSLKGNSFSDIVLLRPIIEKLVGRGILWAEGAEHKRQRRILSPAFRCVYDRVLILASGATATTTCH